MNRQALRALLIPLLLLAAVALACSVGNPIENNEVIGTAAALAPTIQAAATKLGPTLEAVATAVAPTLEAVATEASNLAPTVEALATDLAPTMEAAATTASELAPTVAAIATPVGGIDEFLSMAQGSEGLSGLASFRQTAVLDFTSNGQTGKVDYWSEFTSSPQATHGRIALSGMASAGLPMPTFEYVIIEGQTWVKIGELPWTQVENTEMLPRQQAYSADDFLFAVPNAQRVLPDTTINGIACKHYVFQVNDYSFDGGSIQAGSGEVFTAIDGGYVVMYTLVGDATLDNFFYGQSGSVNLIYNVFDVNSGLVIEPPR